MGHLRDLAKRIAWVRKGYSMLWGWTYAAATLVSPTLNTRLRYYITFGKKLNLQAPKCFHEKLLWLKLNQYMNNPLVIQCADKYLVREYVQQCGCGHILNELLGVWSTVEDIPWNQLPRKFVLKWNFGAGFNLICTDKTCLNKDEVFQQFNEWKKKKCWLSYSEMQYKYIPKRIICETFLEECEGKRLRDFKVYCFHGEPKAILVMHDREKTVKTEFFDTKWVKLDNTKKYEEPTVETEKPLCLDQMLDVAEKLSKPFPFVRCDFYIVNGRLYFGELTFTPAAGLYTSETLIHGINMADLIHLPTDDTVL